jgi:hypothetical protein
MICSIAFASAGDSARAGEQSGEERRIGKG